MMVSVRSHSRPQGEFIRASSTTHRVNAGVVTKEAEHEEVVEQIGCGYFCLTQVWKRVCT